VTYLALALAGALLVGAIILWVYTVRDLFRRRDLTTFQRVMWLVVIIVAPFLGVLIYWLLKPRSPG